MQNAEPGLRIPAILLCLFLAPTAVAAAPSSGQGTAGLCALGPPTGDIFSNGFEGSPTAAAHAHKAMNHHIDNFCVTGNVQSTKSGLWSDPSVWSTGQVPADTDGVVVNHDVTFNVTSTAKLACVRINTGAALRFSDACNTEMHVTTLLNLGTLQIGTRDQPIDAGVSAQIVINDEPLAALVDLSNGVPIADVRDAALWGTAVISLGDFVAHGSPIDPTFVRLSQVAQAGSRTIAVERDLTGSGWKSGDRLVLAGSSQANGGEGVMVPREWEELTVQSVSGSTITVHENLQFDHGGAVDADGNLVFLPHVANMTRNVIIRSENPLGTRGHTAFVGRAFVDVRYVGFLDLGRTTVDPPDNTTFDAGGVPDHIGTNPLARYPVHWHHVRGQTNKQVTDLPHCQAGGQLPTGCQFAAIGNVVDNTVNTFRKWGYVVHGTGHGVLADNVGYNVAGAIFAFEDGNEWENVWDRNFAVRSLGNEDPDEDVFSRSFGTFTPRNPRDFGFVGSCFWFRGLGNHIVNNVASGCREGFGTVQGSNVEVTGSGGKDYVPIPAFPGADPYVDFLEKDVVPSFVNHGDPDRYDPELYITFFDFDNNESYSTRFGIDFWRVVGGRYHYVKNHKFWHIAEQAVHLQYANLWHFDNPTIISDASKIDVSNPDFNIGFDFSVGYDHKVVIRGGKIHNTTAGILPSTIHQYIEGGDWANYVNLRLDNCSSGTGCFDPQDMQRYTLKDVGLRSLSPAAGTWAIGEDAFVSNLVGPYAINAHNITVDGENLPDFKLLIKGEGCSASGVRPSILGVLCFNNVDPDPGPPVPHP